MNDAKVIQAPPVPDWLLQPPDYEVSVETYLEMTANATEQARRVRQELGLA